MRFMNTAHYFESFQGDYSIRFKDTQGAERAGFHIHDVFELTLITEGTLECTVNDRCFIAGKNTVLLFNNMDLHRSLITQQKRFKRYVLWFRFEYIEGLSSPQTDLMECYFFRPFEKAQCLELDDENAYRLTELLERLLQADAIGEAFGHDLLIRFLIGEVLILVNRVYLKTHGISAVEGREAYGSVYTVIQHIHAHQDQPLSVMELAALSYISNRRLGTLFRSVTGYSPGQYMLRCKLQQAKLLLLNGRSVEEACQTAGFNNPSNFSRTFKKHVGVSPKQFVMRQRRGQKHGNA